MCWEISLPKLEVLRMAHTGGGDLGKVVKTVYFVELALVPNLSLLPEQFVVVVMDGGQAELY